MRKMPSYRIEHFQSNKFYASQYLALIDLINLELELNEKSNKQFQKDAKRKR